MSFKEALTFCDFIGFNAFKMVYQGQIFGGLQYKSRVKMKISKLFMIKFLINFAKEQRAW